MEFAAKEKLEIVKDCDKAADAGTIERNFGTFGEVFGELTPPEQRELLQLLIKEVLYDADKSRIRMALRPLPYLLCLINGMTFATAKNPIFTTISKTS